MKMLRPLLAERFRLRFHRETRQMRIYSLVVAKHGPKLRDTEAGVRGFIRPGRGLIEGRNINMSTLADFLGGSLGQSVTNKTGLSGGFDIKLEWAPTEGELDYNFNDRPIDTSRASLFTAIQEQLGLKLELRKGPVEVLVIDQVERPSEN